MTRFVRAYPEFAVVAVLAALVGLGAIYTGTVGAPTAHRAGSPTAPAVHGAGPTGSPAGRPHRRPPTGPSARAGLAPAPGRSVPPGTGRDCRLSARLVPSCGVLWGVAPGAYTDLQPTQALADFEEKTGRPASILHEYHRGDELFPTADEIAATRQDGGHRLLLINWKVDWGTTWANVAAGGADARIDRLAGYVKRTYRDPFYLAVHHEPENDVKPAAGSGMTAQDYAAMFRHTVRRLRADGVTNAISVMIYMDYQPWCVQPWFGQLWPGDNVVDWVGFDPYLYAQPGKPGHGDFEYLVNRTTDPARWPGFYTWVTRTHGDKPLMIAEWGVYEYPSDPAQKAWIYSTVLSQLRDYPAIRAMVYFESPAAPKGDTRPDSSTPALVEYRKLAESSVFGVRIGGG